MEDGFRFEYDPPVLRYGEGCVRDLGDEVAKQGHETALVVCGSNVGDSEAAELVHEGLGDRLAGVFAETTPDKRLETAYDALEEMRESDADVLVGLGGGSSLDVARVAAVLATRDETREEVARDFSRKRILALDGSPPPVFAVPTTLAGADMSNAGGVTLSSDTGLLDGEELDDDVSGAFSDARLMPSAVFHDPAVFATTPRSALAGSAMNGFNKGIETLYSSNATHVTDATASRGTRLLKDGLLAYGREEGGLDDAAEGIALVQYGISRGATSTVSVIHAFGHALTHDSGLQQGVAHAVVTPHVLRYLFEKDGVDAKRRLVADALCVEDDAEAVVGAVEEVRDTLNLPTRLRDVDGPEPEEFDEVAGLVVKDYFMPNAPEGLDATRDEMRDVLEKAW
ncbi:MAG: iron-containing alcohol dehydrogenase family protein [Halobacteriales archaeon]|nr:iron-containing alcohol dehydrogenase family protein [Halobacteriales archaeon]